MTTLTITITMPQVEAADLIMVKAEPSILRVYTTNRSQRPQYSHRQFQNYRYQRSTPQQNCTHYGNAHKPYFQGNQSNTYRG